MHEKLIDAVDRIGDAANKVLADHKNHIEALTQRVESIEATSNRPNGHATQFSRKDAEHRDVFLDWLRAPRDGIKRRAIEEAQHEMLRDKHGTKAVTIASGSSGGYAVPEIIDREVERRVRLLNPFRELVRTVQVGSSDYKQLISKNSASSGWVGEGDSRSETTTSDLIECAPTFGTIYAYPKASEESLQDVFFDVQGWLVEEVADGFSAAEAQAIVSGNGTSKPSGFLNTTPVTTADDASPERAATALQFLPLTNSPQSLNADDLIELALSVKERYLLDGQSVAWVMRRSTAAIIRKLKDDQGQFLWQPSLQAGQPNLLLGYPVALTDAML